jgi:uncharacterized protein (DUF1800 family)
MPKGSNKCRPCLRSLILAGTMLGPLAATTTHAQPTQRQLVQHLLRRFTYGAPPEAVTTVLNEGTDTWLAQQLNWQAIDDSQSELEQLPTQLNAQGGYDDYQVFERILMQHNILTNRQLQAKLELHWLDHFAVSLQKVGDPALMSHYDATVRANALGNFAALLAAVSAEPAMLYWLDNNYNYGGTPNENFARELMQLYSTGPVQLNPDGTQVLDGNGLPVPNYTQRDVVEIANAMTGFGVLYDYNNNNPETRFSVEFVPGYHYDGPLKFLGKHRNVPQDQTAIAYVCNILAHQPSTAPFQVSEMLKRFAIEKPSRNFIADIVAVWTENVDAPDQIGQVVSAIMHHKDFAAAYHGMLKQPAETVTGSLRQLPGMMQATQYVAPGGSLLWELSNLNQELFYPPSVFSFYTPGHVGNTINAATRLNRTNVFANIVNGAQSNQYTDTWIDIPTLRTRIGSTKKQAIADYLLDALVDGGSAKLRDIIMGFMGETPDDAQIQGAMWLLLNTPDYAVN